MKIKFCFAWLLLIFAGQVGAMDANVGHLGDAVDAVSDISTVILSDAADDVARDVTAFEIEMGNVQMCLDGVEKLLSDQKRMSGLRSLRYVRRLYLHAHDQRDYRSLINLIQELKVLEQGVLTPNDDVQNEVSIVIENLENLDASQDGEVISEYQELVWECGQVFEAITALLGEPVAAHVLEAVNDASDKIDLFRDVLTPHVVAGCVDALRNVADSVLHGRAKRTLRKEAQQVAAKLLSLSAE